MTTKKYIVVHMDTDEGEGQEEALARLEELEGETVTIDTEKVPPFGTSEYNMYINLPYYREAWRKRHDSD